MKKLKSNSEIFYEDKVEMPSNRSFGWFFTLIFCLVGIYFALIGNKGFATALFLVGVFFSFLTVFRESWLLPLNRLWFKIGMLMARLINPLVMAVLFSICILPLGMFFKIIGRDLLRLNKPKGTQWIHSNKVTTDFSKPY